MLTLLLALALSHGLPQPPMYSVQVDVIQPAGTVTTRLVLEEGVLGSVAIKGTASVTVVRARVNQSTVAGCLQVDVGSATGPDEETVLKRPVRTPATIHLCGVSTGRIRVDDSPLYQVVVELASPGSQ